MQKPITIVKCLLLLPLAGLLNAAVAAEPAAATIWCTLYRKAITLIMRLQNQKTQSHWRRLRRVCVCVGVCVTVATHTRHFRLPNPIYNATIYAAKRGVPQAEHDALHPLLDEPGPAPSTTNLSSPSAVSLSSSLSNAYAQLLTLDVATDKVVLIAISFFFYRFALQFVAVVCSFASRGSTSITRVV